MTPSTGPGWGLCDFSLLLGWGLLLHFLHQHWSHGELAQAGKADPGESPRVRAHRLGSQVAGIPSSARDALPQCYKLPAFPRRSLTRDFQEWGVQRQKPLSGSSGQHTRKRHYKGTVRGAETLDINISIFPCLLLARKCACVGGTPALCHKNTWIHCCMREPTNLTPLSTEPALPIALPYQAVTA